MTLDFTFEFKPPDTALFRGQGPEIARRHLTAATEFGVSAAVGAIVPLTPVNLGILRGGVQSDVRGEGADVLGRVFDNVPYALPMETGTKPIFPPVAALVPWVTRKFGVSGKEARSVAFLVARSIRRKGGLKARKFFGAGWATVKPAVKARYVAAQAAVLAELGG